jgi:Rrf2 family protein
LGHQKSKPVVGSHAKPAILVEIARHGGKGPVNAAAIAAAAGISVPHIEYGCSWLRRRRLIRSVRGAGGGYVLARPASGIYVADIIHSLKGWFGKKYRGTDTEAADNILELWDQSEGLLMQVYRHISLADVIRGDLQAHPFLKKLTDSCHQEKQKRSAN